MRRVGNIDYEQSARRCHVKSMAGRGDKCRTGQRAVWIETNGFAFLQEIVVWISIDQRRDIADDESFFAVGDENERIEEIDRLLFVFGKMLARGIERECARQRDARCVSRVNAGALTKRRDRRANDALRKSFLIAVRDIENFKAARTVRGVEIFAAQPDILN